MVRKNKEVAGSCLTDFTCQAVVDIRKMRFLASTVWPTLLLRYSAQLDLIMRHKGKGPVRVLDMGCANGALVRLWCSPNFSTIARQIGLHYTGIDMDKTALEEARAAQPEVGKYYLHHCEFIEHDLTKKMAFAKDESFDIVFYTETIEHVPEDKAQFTLHEAYRVLKKGGLLFICTPAPKGDYLVWPDAHTHEFKKEETEAMLAKAGFTVEDCWGCGVNWQKAGGWLKKENAALHGLLKKLKRRIGATWACAVMQAVVPEVCEDIVWLCKKGTTR